MHFIERIFGIYPDGGNGALEALCLLALAASIVALRSVRGRRFATTMWRRLS